MKLHLRDALQDAARIIDLTLKTFQQPVVMWSSGKDSMVLLYLLRARKLDLPVIFHRDNFFPEKNAFADSVIQDWGLKVHDWPPSRAGLQEANGLIELVSHYQFGPSSYVSIPKNRIEPFPQESAGRLKKTRKYICALRDHLHRQTGAVSYPWGAVFHGHKSSDVDPAYGPVPINCDIRQAPGVPALAFPLRKWTDELIWEYTEKAAIPVDQLRYSYRTERTDKTSNPDYIPACVRCLDRRGPATVWCPKLNAEVANVSTQAQYFPLAKLEYIGEEAAK